MHWERYQPFENPPGDLDPQMGFPERDDLKLRRTLGLDNNRLLGRIANSGDIDTLLRTFGSQFITRRVAILSVSATLVIARNKVAKGYLIGVPLENLANITPFTSAVRVPATYNSATTWDFGMAKKLAMFLDVTANVGASALTIAMQSQDPTSSNWVQTQGDLFSGNAAVGTYYAVTRELGLDANVRFQAIVTGGTSVTFTLSAEVISTPTLYLGNSNMTTAQGFNLPAGSVFPLYLKENTELYGRVTGAPFVSDITVAELQ